MPRRPKIVTYGHKNKGPNRALVELTERELPDKVSC